MQFKMQFKCISVKCNSVKAHTEESHSGNLQSTTFEVENEDEGKDDSENVEIREEDK